MLPKIHFPISLYENYGEIVADTTINNKLVSLDPLYLTLLNRDSAKYFTDLTFHRFDTYIHSPKITPFKKFIDAGQLSIIERLLFSPNHIVSIYAFEALNENQTELKDQTKLQMQRVLNSTIKIKWQSSNVGYFGKTYKELKSSY